MSRVKNTRKCPTCGDKVGKLKRVYNVLNECKGCYLLIDKKESETIQTYHGLSHTRRFLTYFK